MKWVFDQRTLEYVRDDGLRVPKDLWNGPDALYHVAHNRGRTVDASFARSKAPDTCRSCGAPTEGAWVCSYCGTAQGATL